ncbi:flagellar hook-length control protein FliK [Metapseudomonas otitidis]|uniref:flagellar hook-length control protein FliK n=1 Tax=Metapseudomonas otitidis TaxID=319939 RepID=UPI0008E20F44|nr:flagellar hook-length control protein FliK [Pseudomonas otitidis]SFA46877.1 flagellar hook-length control protein FliK [Pseudomonas otitidis]
MPVAPDMLLQAKPEVKPNFQAAKSQVRTPEPSNSGAPSFAQMYAKERQAKPAERSEPAPKQARDKPADNRKSDEPADKPAAAPADKPTTVADSGNALPSDAAATTTSDDSTDTTSSDGSSTLDPLLLMAMNGQTPPVPTEPQVQPADVQPEVPALVVTTPLATTPQTQATQPRAEETDPLQGVVGLPQTLQASNEGDPVQTATTTTVNSQNSASGSHNFASAMAAFSEKNADVSETPPEVELPAGEFSEQLVQGLGENKAEIRSEVLDSRLNALNQAVTQQSAMAQRAPAVVPGQPVAINQNGWSEAVVDRVMWLSSQNLKSAEIQLDPQELGRLEVRIHMNQDQTQVTFASPNAGVRDALEGQMHRLRDMFNQQGMTQLDVNVSDQSLARSWQGQQGGEGERRGGGSGNGGLLGGSGDDETLAGVSELRPAAAGVARGLVDYYA